MVDDANDDDARFAASVKAFRQRREWNQTDLAKMLNEMGHSQFHPTTISRIESGERAVRLSEARAIARLFSTSVSVLVEPPQVASALQDFSEWLESAETEQHNLGGAVINFEAYQARLRETLPAVEQRAAQGDWLDDAVMSKSVEDKLNRAKRMVSLTAEEIIYDARDGEYGPSEVELDALGEQMIQSLQDEKRGK